MGKGVFVLNLALIFPFIAGSTNSNFNVTNVIVIDAIRVFFFNHTVSFRDISKGIYIYISAWPTYF